MGWERECRVSGSGSSVLESITEDGGGAGVICLVGGVRGDDGRPRHTPTAGWQASSYACIRHRGCHVLHGSQHAAALRWRILKDRYSTNLTRSEVL